MHPHTPVTACCCQQDEQTAAGCCSGRERPSREPPAQQEGDTSGGTTHVLPLWATPRTSSPDATFQPLYGSQVASCSTCRSSSSMRRPFWIGARNASRARSRSSWQGRPCRPWASGGDDAAVAQPGRLLPGGAPALVRTVSSSCAHARAASGRSPSPVATGIRRACHPAGGPPHRVTRRSGDAARPPAYRSGQVTSASAKPTGSLAANPVPHGVVPVEDPARCRPAGARRDGSP